MDEAVQELSEIVLANLTATSTTSTKSSASLVQSARRYFQVCTLFPACTTPPPAVLDALLLLIDKESPFLSSSLPVVTPPATTALLLVISSTPAAWQSATTAAALRTTLAPSTLRILTAPKTSRNPVDEPLYNALLHLSDVNSWERNAFLTTIPHTPISLAVTALHNNPPSKTATTSLLRTLISVAPTSAWQSVTAHLPYDSPVFHVLQSTWKQYTADNDKERPFPSCLTYRLTPPEVDVSGLDASSILHALCTIPSFLNALQHAPPPHATKTQTVPGGNDDSPKLQSKPPSPSKNNERPKSPHKASTAACAAASTILTGLHNRSVLHNPQTLAILQILLQKAAQPPAPAHTPHRPPSLTRTPNDQTLPPATIDTTLHRRVVEQGLTFLLSENRHLHGIPPHLAPIAFPLLHILAATPSLACTSDMKRNLHAICNGSTTPVNVRKAAERALFAGRNPNLQTYADDV